MGSMFRKKPPVPGTGYLRSRVSPEELIMVGRWVGIKETFESPETESGILIARQGTQHVTRGRILRCGPEAGLDDLAEGDEVLYEEWQGGRHNFDGSKVLVMSLENIICKVEAD